MIDLNSRPKATKLKENMGGTYHGGGLDNGVWQPHQSSAFKSKIKLIKVRQTEAAARRKQR